MPVGEICDDNRDRRSKNSLIILHVGGEIIGKFAPSNGPPSPSILRKESLWLLSPASFSSSGAACPSASSRRIEAEFRVAEEIHSRNIVLSTYFVT